MSKSLLDIVTRAERPTFTIDGESYEMRHPGELSMAEYHLLQQHGAALVHAGKAYEKNPEGAFEDIQSSMTGLFDLVTPDLPNDVRQKLNPFHLQQIVDRFTRLARLGGGQGGPQKRKKSSRGSSASTAAAARNTG